MSSVPHRAFLPISKCTLSLRSLSLLFPCAKHLSVAIFTPSPHLSCTPSAKKRAQYLVSPRVMITYTAVARTRTSPYGVPFFPCPTCPTFISLAHADSIDLELRSGTVAPTPSRHNSEATQAVCSLSNMHRKNTGCSVRQVCPSLFHDIRRSPK